MHATDLRAAIACGVCVDVCNKGSLSLSVERRAVEATADAAGPGRPGPEEWRKPAPPVTAPAPQPDTATPVVVTAPA